MAPIKNQKDSTTYQLTELRRDIISMERSLVRIESSLMYLTKIVRNNRSSTPDAQILAQPSNQPLAVKPITSNRSTNQHGPTMVPRSRQLLQDIANRPVSNKICWYHRQFGAATNPKNCLPGCTYKAPPVIRPPTPVAPNPVQEPMPIANPVQEPIPIANPTVLIPVPSNPIVSNQIMDTSDNYDLEEDLLNLSE